ncbi:hypothetical protein [Ancylobacter terrae]|uniref:hypothetical protein n=1 Tax=Ancylobacter sp. sgz301288 TaxID=3342077 RepID=UPI00385CA5F4
MTLPPPRPGLSARDALARFAPGLPPRRPSLLLAGPGEMVARLYPVWDAALRERPDIRLVIAVPRTELAMVRRRYPHEIVLALPREPQAPAWRARLGVLAVAAPDADPTRTVAQLLASAPPAAAGTLRERMLRRLAGPPLDSVAALGRRLGEPGAIVCLGNGPSSEHPDLAALASDAALFRVNWIWRARGVLTAPDVVFTVDPDLPEPGRAPVILFPTAATGLPILTRHALRLRPPRAGYGFLDRFEPPVAELSLPRIPTNGALMVAVAAALKPARLVIAGIDLYRHPGGRYPGDTDAVDGYAREHSADLDLAVIAAALAGFDGEVVILGAPLRAALGRG